MTKLFKMNPKTPFMKALVGKQGNLPQYLKQAILDTPAKKATEKLESQQGTKETKDAGVTYYGTKQDLATSDGPSENQASDSGRVYASSTKADGTKTRPSTQSFKKAREYESAEDRYDKEQMKKKKGSGGKSPAKSYGKSPVKKTEATQAMKNIRSKTTTSSGEKRMSNTPSKSRRKVYTKGSSSPSEVSYIKKEKSVSAIKPRGVKKANIKASAGKSPAKMKGVKVLKKKK
jgi:hypothetical protein